MHKYRFGHTSQNQAKAVLVYMGGTGIADAQVRIMGREKARKNM